MDLVVCADVIAVRDGATGCDVATCLLCAGQGTLSATPTLNISAACQHQGHNHICQPSGSAFSSSAHDAELILQSFGAVRLSLDCRSIFY
jgi:hypothetical protein